MSEYLSVFRSKDGEKQVLGAYDAIQNSFTFPYEEFYIDTRLGQTHVIACGDKEAPPLILIHAFYASSMAWYRNIETLSEHFRVFVVDIIGDPNKSKPFKPIRQLSLYVDWFNDVMNKLELEKADFIGNSVGAFHIMNFALNHPERVNRMVLIAPAASLLKMPAFYYNTFPGGMTGWTFLIRHAVKWIENGSPFEPEYHNLFYLLMKHGKSANQVFPKVFTDEELKSIKTPTLLIYGDKEVIYDINSAIKRAVAFMPNIKSAIIPGANHITAASRPEEVNKVMVEYLVG